MSSTPIEVPFNHPVPEGDEAARMQEALLSGHTHAGGPFSAQAASLLQEATGAEEVLLTTSCTAALEMTALLLDLQPGDTVIVPSFTFTSSALAFARQGARILFCDIEPVTLGVDPQSVAALVDDSVRAVVVVHYAGVACDIDGLREVLADRPDVAIIEDNAHGLFGGYRGQPLGSLGRWATQSFHDTKNFVCGEGGALLVNEPGDVDRARVIYDKGTDRRAFFLGQVDKYSWRDTGSSFGLSDLLAAYLLAQLERRSQIQSRRKAIYDGYHSALQETAPQWGITLPTVPEYVDPAYHLFHVLMPTSEARDAVMADLRAQGIQTTFHYVPLHDSDGGRRFAARPTECPVSVDVSRRLIRLPFYNSLPASDVERVTEALLSATERHV